MMDVVEIGAMAVSYTKHDKLEELHHCHYTAMAAVELGDICPRRISTAVIMRLIFSRGGDDC